MRGGTHLYIAHTSAFGGLFKIGRSVDPACRIKWLRSIERVPLTLLAVVPNVGHAERALQRVFADSRAKSPQSRRRETHWLNRGRRKSRRASGKSEWFAGSARMKALVKALARRNPSLAIGSA